MKVRWLINGVPDGRVDAADRGLAYGDGLFETMAVHRGTVRLLDHHFERLVEGCDRLAIPRPDLDTVAAEVAAQSAELERAVVKLTITRGPGGRGYRPPARVEPTRILGIFPWPEPARPHYTRGIVLASSNIPIGENERLAGLKHLCRLEQVLAQLDLTGRGADEALQKRRGGKIVGGTASNVFLVRDGRLSTPSLLRCGVRGVMRRVVMDACRARGLTVEEVDIVDSDLRAADEVFVTNAVTGIRPVREYEGHGYAVGPVTRELQRAIHAEAES